MPFQYRDLLITMLPQGTDFGRLFGSSMECDGGSENPPGPPPPPPGPDSGVRNIMIDPVEMRALLQLALTQLGGPVSANELQPRSAADLQQLEERLQAALTQVRATRARFGS